MVFQNYALYPHMSVRENIGFGCDSARRRRTRSGDASPMSRTCSASANCWIASRASSRVAASACGTRTCHRPTPAVFLMDEPLSNLDAKLRAQTRAELIRLHHELGATFIYVTHDQVEATTMGEQVVVMNHGLIQQAAPPREIYLAPTNTFVAGFVGSPPMNLVPATAVRMDSGIGLNLGGAAIPVNGVLGRLLETVGPDRFTLGVRPEHVRIDAESGLRYRVEFVELMGHDTVVHLRGEGAPLLARWTRASRPITAPKCRWCLTRRTRGCSTRPRATRCPADDLRPATAAGGITETREYDCPISDGRRGIMRRTLAVTLSLVLVVAMLAGGLTGCKKKVGTVSSDDAESVVTTRVIRFPPRQAPPLTERPRTRRCRRSRRTLPRRR